jgi:succinate-semialdehyde dehydrogenase/glutarate-semialdehyde dehydrogenase
MSCFDHLPDGVLGVLLGDHRTGRALVDAEIDGVVFTGSVPAGLEIARRCSARLVRTVLELGGNDALVVDEDVDAEWAAAQAATGCFANAGQICVAVERIFCHDAVFEPFTAALVRRAQALVMGPGRSPRTQVGPLVDTAHRAAVHAHVTEAVQAGADLRCGGTLPAGPGAFYPPTVLCDVPVAARVMREETFGPVAPVVKVSSFDAALDAAASVPHGLAAVVLTADQAHAQRAWRRLPVGTVKINSAFGGAPGGAAHPHGISGNALGYGPELLDELTRVRMVHMEPAPTIRRSGSPSG